MTRLFATLAVAVLSLMSCEVTVGQSVFHIVAPAADDNPPEPKQAEADRAAQKKAAEEAKKAAEAAKKQAEEAQQKKQARLQQIQQLQFDRRASTILKTWSEIAQAPPKKNDDNKIEEETEASSKTEETSADPFAEDVKIFQRDVTLGRWNRVKHFLADLPEDEGAALYTRLLQALQRPMEVSMAGMTPEQIAQMLMQQQQQGKRLEPHSFAFDDVIALVGCCPGKVESTSINVLGSLLQQTLSQGNVIEELVERLKKESEQEDGVVTKRQAAKLLMAAGRVLDAGKFLPDVDTAKEENDFDGLNMLSRYYLQQHQEEEKAEFLEQAWDVVQAVLASDDTTTEQKDQALKRAVDIAPKIREELGSAWLNESFTERPERGMESLPPLAGQPRGACNRMLPTRRGVSRA